MIKQLLAAMLAAQIALGIGPAKVQAEDNYSVNAQIANSANSITESVANEQVQNRVNTGPHVFAAVTASGKWGTCPWSLSSDGVLTIGAGTGEIINWRFSVPWYSQRANIKSVKFNGEVRLPEAIHYLFSGCSNLTTIDVSNWDTSAVTVMANVFENCTSLTTLDVSKWNTSKVMDMDGLFDGCSNLTTLDVSKWDTNAVTDMNYMFHGCSSLTTLDVSNWDTSAVWNMSHMFAGCSNLTTLDISNWNTSKVTYMNYMFHGCNSLTALDVSNWNTSAVTNMNSMFDNCKSITALNVSKWNTSKVTDMGGLFGGCSSLTTLDVSKWDTSAVTNMSWMFNNCSKLTTLDVSKWNTGAVTNMSRMFSWCSSLTKLDISNFDTSAVTGMNWMFYWCSRLASIKIGPRFVNSAKSSYVFPAPSKTISGKDSTGTWGLGSETADKQYKADELATLGQTPGALTGTWYAQRKELTFKSWNTKPDGSGTTYKPGDALPNQNLDLYAQWG